MENLTDRLIKKLEKKNLIDDALGPLKIRYALSAIKNETVKLALLIVIFYRIGLLTPLFFTMILIVPIRVTTGGLHFQSNTGCFLASLSFFLLAIIGLPQLAIQRALCTLILLASVALIFIFPLAPSVKRPIISQKKYHLNKYLSVSFTLIVMTYLLFVVDNQHFYQCGIWALCLQAIQLAYLAVIKNIKKSFSLD